MDLTERIARVLYGFECARIHKELLGLGNAKFRNWEELIPAIQNEFLRHADLIVVQLESK